MLMERVVADIKKKKSPIVMGLDPVLSAMPVELRPENHSPASAAQAILEFNKGLIDATLELIPAVKPQVAFYEQYGPEGMNAYRETCIYASQKGLAVIGDIKRGDIGSTSRAYSVAHLGQTEDAGTNYNAFPSDYITVNPYLGDDCIKEFMDDVRTFDKGLFILVKTSNPTSSQLQNLVAEGRPIYEHVAQIVDSWSRQNIGESGYSPVGAVVGATYPSEAEALRKLMPTSYFLVPGYGAQGGGGADVVPCFNDDGLGALVNSSRGIINAWKNDKYKQLSWKEAAKAAVLDMRKDINGALEAAGKSYWQV